MDTTKIIPLTQGMLTKVDAGDYEFLMQWKWFVHKCAHLFYAERRQGANKIKMHRLLLGITDPKIFVDHIDRDGLNNQRENLRIVSATQNTFNRRKRINSLSKYKGLSYDKVSEKWFTEISAGGKRIYLGRFATQEEAALAYNEAAIKIHGEFANLNIL